LDFNRPHCTTKKISIENPITFEKYLPINKNLIFYFPPHSKPREILGLVKINKTETCTNTFSIYTNTTVFVQPVLFVDIWTPDKRFSGNNDSGNNSPSNYTSFSVSSEVPP